VASDAAFSRGAQLYFWRRYVCVPARILVPLVNIRAAQRSCPDRVRIGEKSETHPVRLAGGLGTWSSYPHTRVPAQQQQQTRHMRDPDIWGRIRGPEKECQTSGCLRQATFAQPRLVIPSAEERNLLLLGERKRQIARRLQPNRNDNAAYYRGRSRPPCHTRPSPSGHRP
jgi:hypothetical protein